MEVLHPWLLNQEDQKVLQKQENQVDQKALQKQENQENQKVLQKQERQKVLQKNQKVLQEQEQRTPSLSREALPYLDASSSDLLAVGDGGVESLRLLRTRLLRPLPVLLGVHPIQEDALSPEHGRHHHQRPGPTPHRGSLHQTHQSLAVGMPVQSPGRNAGPGLPEEPGSSRRSGSAPQAHSAVKGVRQRMTDRPRSDGGESH